jgi:beta-glucanase (GH16 family)
MRIWLKCDDGGRAGARWLFSAVVLFAFSAAGAADDSAVPPTLAGKTFLTLPGEEWNLLWHDEFDGDHLDNSKWTSGMSWTGDDGTNRHHNDQYASYITDDDVVLHDGQLYLLTRKQDVANPSGKIYHYTQAFIQTNGKFTYTYGYCEVRIKVPAEDGPGLWPAFWMLSQGWPPEDDVAEFWTGRPLPHTHQGYAYRATDGSVKWDSSHKNSILSGFHTFGMEWGPGYQIMNRDGVIRNVSYGWRVTNLPMYLILNSGVASDPAPTAKTVFPNAFVVDYVRVYARPPVLSFLNRGFEADSPAPWTLSGKAAIANSNAHAGQRALRLPVASASATQTVFGLIPKVTYRLSAWADTAARGTLRLGVKNFGSAPKYATVQAGGYQQLSVDFTPDEGISTATISCEKLSGDGDSFFDDIAVTPMDSH